MIAPVGTSQDPFIAFDCAGPHLVAAVGVGQKVLSQHHVDMARGQGEALLPFLEQRLSDAGMVWKDLGAIVVGVGPGNFTGIRIAVSAARGLSLGLGIPAVGVSAFECLGRAEEGAGSRGVELRVLPAPRGAAYGQLFQQGRPDGAPEIFEPDAPPRQFQRAGLSVLGYRAPEIAARLNGEGQESATPLPDLATRLLDHGAFKLSREAKLDRPAPLYVKPADAAPPRDAPPVLID